MAEDQAKDAESDGDGGEPTGYTIDELSAMTGVPSRTIRFYQAKGALPAPERRGRVAYYDDDHVERLKLVGHLQDRGLSLKAIRDLMQRADAGDISVGEWLGVGEMLRAPWSDDRPRLYTDVELLELIGENNRPGLIADLVRTGMLRREGAGEPATYMCPSPGLLHIALKLDEAGISTDAAETAHEILRRRLARAADDLAEFFMQRAGDDALDAEEVGRSVQALRTLGIEAVRLVFAQEIERALRAMVEEGKLLPPRGRGKGPSDSRRRSRRRRGDGG